MIRKVSYAEIMDAVQITEDCAEDLKNLLGETAFFLIQEGTSLSEIFRLIPPECYNKLHNSTFPICYIPSVTLNPIFCEKGDWIVKHFGEHNKEMYSVKNKIFNSRYEII